MTPSTGRTRDQAVVFLAAVLVPAWILRLPFQLDDYPLLLEPLRLFDLEWAHADEDIVPFMLRWPMWIAWAVAGFFAGEPRSPGAYHVFGLLLHGVVAVLITRVVNRRCPWAEGRAGLFAGLVFVVASGHLQAVSWIAAWSGLLYTLFGWLAFELFEQARVSEARGRLCLFLATSSVWLALVSKTPGLVVLGPLAWGLAVTAWADRKPGRFWRCELPALLFALGVGLVCRFWFLGTLSLRYYKTTASAESIFDRLPRGWTGLGQALYPWNADPLFNGEAPWLARLGIAAPWIGLAALGAVLLAGVIFAARARRSLTFLFVALIPCTLPLAMLFAGQPTNVASRAAYIAMGVVAAIFGVVLAGLGGRARAVCLALSALFFADGTLHYARTELAAGAEIDGLRRLGSDLRAEHTASGSSRELVLLALVPNAGFAGIPSLGPHIGRALSSPWVEDPVRVELFTDGAHLARTLGAVNLAQSDLVVIGPAVDEAWSPVSADPTASGASNRELRSLRALHPIRSGLAEGGLALEESAEGWIAPTPIPAHALATLELELNGASLGEFVAYTASGSFELASYEQGEHVEPGPVRRELVTQLSAQRLLGPPIERIEWRGEGEKPRLALSSVAPTVEILGAEDDPSIVAGADGIPEPAWQLRVGPGVRPAYARLEMAVTFLDGSEHALYSDTPVPTDGDVVTVRPSSLHPGLAPPPVAGLPWEEVTGQVLLPDLAGRRMRRTSFRWRVALYAADGSIMAQSDYRHGKFESNPGG